MPLPVVGAAPLAAGVAHDLELARRHAAGDLAAFEEVYRSHSALVFNLCRRLSGDPDEALDAAQEVFLRVHRHLGRFHGRSTLRTWIYRVAVNQCRRRFARRPPPALPLETASSAARWAAPGPDPEQRAARAEAEECLERALAGVPLRFRAAVVLRDVEGLAYPEIAEVLGVPVGTVRSRIARGREALRTRLTEGR
jgi:RNA polymerase sigma-70 factor (ECF subfamily)